MFNLNFADTCEADIIIPILEIRRLRFWDLSQKLSTQLAGGRAEALMEMGLLRLRVSKGGPKGPHSSGPYSHPGVAPPCPVIHANQSGEMKLCQS